MIIKYNFIASEIKFYPKNVFKLTKHKKTKMTAQLRLLLSNKGVCYEIENYQGLDIENGKRTAKTHRNINGNSRTKTEQRGNTKNDDKENLSKTAQARGGEFSPFLL